MIQNLSYIILHYRRLCNTYSFTCITSCLYPNWELFMVKIRWQIRVIFILRSESSWHVSMNAHLFVHILIVFISYFYFWIDWNWKIIQGKCKKPLDACLCDLLQSLGRYLYDLLWYSCIILGYIFSFPLNERQMSSKVQKKFLWIRLIIDLQDTYYEIIIEFFSDLSFFISWNQKNNYTYTCNRFHKSFYIFSFLCLRYRCY